MRKRYSLKKKAPSRKRPLLAAFLVAVLCAGAGWLIFGPDGDPTEAPKEVPIRSEMPSEPKQSTEARQREEAEKPAPSPDAAAEGRDSRNGDREVNGEDTANSGIPPEPARLALLTFQKGPFEDEGAMLRQGAELAWQELERSEIPATLSVPDPGDDPEAAAHEATLLAEDSNVLAVVVHLPASVLGRIAPLYEKKGRPLIVPANSHQSVVGKPWLIPLVPPDRQQARFAARKAAESAQGKPVAVVSSPDAYGRLLEKAFLDQAGELAMTVHTYRWSGDRKEKEQAAANLLSLKPGLIWLAGSPLWAREPVHELVDELPGCRFIAPQSFDVRFLEDLFGGCIDRFLLVRPVLADQRDNEELTEFRKRFQERFWRDPDWLAVLGYETFAWMASCFEKSGGKIEPAELRACFRNHDAPQRAWPGLSGPVYFDENGAARRDMRLAVYRNGGFVPAPNSP